METLSLGSEVRLLPVPGIVACIYPVTRCFLWFGRF